MCAVISIRLQQSQLQLARAHDPDQTHHSAVDVFVIDRPQDPSALDFKWESHVGGCGEVGGEVMLGTQEDDDSGFSAARFHLSQSHCHQIRTSEMVVSTIL